MSHLKKLITSEYINAKIAQRPIMVFAKSYIPECKDVAAILSSIGMYKNDYEICNIEKRQDCALFETYLMKICDQPSRQVPRIFIKGKYFGGYEELVELYESGLLKELVNKNHWSASQYKAEYDVN